MNVDRSSHGGAGHWKSSTRLPFGFGHLGAQRQRMLHDLDEHALPDDVAYDASLVLDELMTNAVQHGLPLDDGNLDVCWGAWDGLIHVEVTSGGALTVPVARAATAVATRGRGLAIVAALALSWGVRTGHTSTTVWAALPPAR
jgi:two-component sensor histidine kinase